MKRVSRDFAVPALWLWLWNGYAMAQTSSRVMSLSLQGQLPPLTLPADCLTTSVYRAETEINGINDEIYYTSSTLVQGCMTDNARSTCCPNYESAGSYNVYYSPGVCPDGYTTLDLNIIVQAYSYSSFDEIKLGLKTGKACCPRIGTPVTYDLYSYGPSCLYSESTSYSTSDAVGPKVISTSRYWSASAYIIIPGTDFTTTFAAPTAAPESDGPESTSAEPGQTVPTQRATSSAGGTTSTGPKDTSSPTNTSEPAAQTSTSISVGAIAGISVGVVAALVGGIFVAYRMGRRKGGANSQAPGDFPARPPQNPHGMGFAEIGGESIPLGKVGGAGQAPPYSGAQEIDGNQYKGQPPYPEMPGNTYQGYVTNKYPELDGNVYQAQGPDRNRYQELDGGR
ncbi:uncharacterized protein DFL_000330 [Arthrobotrys flagrans]|uniref:Mid2 domain-containing protein n=1 Tax=Arthrobotrys flagrans TaxID=97331 RepID=A0A437AEU3_ARTFL|nr:hypothetical protein DFL_000330 [Arthrobotrys flagrans]